MRTLSKHVRLALLLSVLSGLLLIISCCPGGSEQATGILQGLATGLISGMVLFLVNGIKEKEYKELKKVWDTIHELSLSMNVIAEAYGDIYHKTYHGKKEQMNFETYLNIVRETYDKYKSAYGSMSHIDVDLISDIKIREGIKKYIEYLVKEIGSLELSINSVKDGDKDFLNEIRDKFYNIQYKAYQLRWDSMMYEREIYRRISKIDNSLI